MSITSASLVKCEVHLTHTHFYPGDAVEGAVVIDAAAAFDVFNVHIKIVGKEEVYAMVDQVKQSKIKDVQFGISSQDYVYYREIVTVAGNLMTQKATQKDKTRRSPLGSRRDEVEVEGEDEEVEDGAGEPIRREAERQGGPEGAEEGEASTCFCYNESLCVRPGVAQQNHSFAVSQLAAEEGVSVRFPAGHYVYPFRFLLPPALPPSYDTGICVKDGQYSNSQAALHYYVKVYVWSPRRVQLGSARADFLLGATQPDYGSSHAAADSSHNTRHPNGESSTGAKGGLSAHNNTGRPSSSPAAVDGAASRAKLTSPTGVSGKTVRCVFPVMGTCSCFSTDAKLRATFTLSAVSFQVERDAIAVKCSIASNTSKKTIRGIKIQLVQVLKFETSDALVTMRKTVQEAEVLTPVEAGKAGTIAGQTKVLSSKEDLMPTMKTSGLEVRYIVRVELLASHIDQAYYEFEDVQLTGAMLAGAVPPVGPMHFTALARGRLTRREAFYAIPTNPSEAPVLATLDAALSLQGSRSVSRRASRLNTAAVTPV